MKQFALILAFIPLASLLLVSCVGVESGGDLMNAVETAPVSGPVDSLEPWPFREGLPMELLPLEADESQLDQASVVQLTTPCGLRTNSDGELLSS